MSGLALALIVVAALLHAIWNCLAKRVNGGALIACYTLWDKYTLSSLLVPPLLLDDTAAR